MRCSAHVSLSQTGSSGLFMVRGHRGSAAATALGLPWRRECGKKVKYGAPIDCERAPEPFLTFSPPVPYPHYALHLTGIPTIAAAPTTVTESAFMISALQLKSTVVDMILMLE
eukprot:IDg21527t1